MTNNLSREKFISRATDLKVIPSLNDIVEKVFSALNNNNSSFNDLRNVVQYDQAISSKIISIANCQIIQATWASVTWCWCVVW